MARPKENTLERFHKHFLTTSNPEDCWLWIGSKNKRGYGNFWFKGKIASAHRVSYILYKEEIPKGMYVCHTCDNPLCVNPNHLFIGTQSTNLYDMMNKHRHPTTQGENNGRSKLTEEKVKEIKNLIKEGFSNISIAKRFTVDRRTIQDIKKGETWSYLR